MLTTGCPHRLPPPLTPPLPRSFCSASCVLVWQVHYAADKQLQLVYLGALVQRGQTDELYIVAHELVETAHSCPVSWYVFAVGVLPALGGGLCLRCGVLQN